ncbi:MAG: hypothetical protein ACFE75_02530 [Candidatus Hodarchaeota archaeon]
MSDKDKDKLEKINSQIKSVGAAKQPTWEDISSLTRLATTVGQEKPKIRHYSREFLRQEIEETETDSAIVRESPPDWLHALVKRKASRQEIFDETFKKLRKNPNERNLRLTQMILNEIGRFEDAGEFLSRQITQKLVNEFLSED